MTNFDSNEVFKVGDTVVVRSGIAVTGTWVGRMGDTASVIVPSELAGRIIGRSMSNGHWTYTVEFEPNKYAAVGSRGVIVAAVHGDMIEHRSSSGKAKFTL